MFIQIIQATCRDSDALHRQLHMWRQEMEDGMAQMKDAAYLDLHHPWFASKA